MPNGTLQQIDKNGNKIIIKESGEVSIYDKGGKQTFKHVDPAAAQFFRTMKKSIEIREKSTN